MTLAAIATFAAGLSSDAFSFPVLLLRVLLPAVSNCRGGLVVCFTALMFVGVGAAVRTVACCSDFVLYVAFVIGAQGTRFPYHVFL